VNLFKNKTNKIFIAVAPKLPKYLITADTIRAIVECT